MKEFIEEILINEIGNENDAQILFGSSPLIRYLDSKMGAGINVQDKLKVLHDVDVPWRPSDVELLEVRKKNEHRTISKNTNANKRIKSLQMTFLRIYVILKNNILSDKESRIWLSVINPYGTY